MRQSQNWAHIWRLIKGEKSIWKRHRHHKVHCSPTYNSHSVEAAIMSIDTWMDQEGVGHIRGNATYPSKRMKICHLQAHEWTQRLTYRGNEEKGKSNISDDIPYMWHPKGNHTNEHIYKIKTDSQISSMNLRLPQGENAVVRVEARSLGRQLNVYTQLFLK